jgi:sodium transport system permease protein
MSRQLARQPLGHPVLVVPPDFEATWPRRGAEWWLVSSANQRAQGGAGSASAAAAAASTRSRPPAPGLRGVAPAALQTVQVEERDLADPARAPRSSPGCCRSSC